MESHLKITIPLEVQSDPVRSHRLKEPGGPVLERCLWSLAIVRHLVSRSLRSSDLRRFAAPALHRPLCDDFIFLMVRHGRLSYYMVADILLFSNIYAHL